MKVVVSSLVAALCLAALTSSAVAVTPAARIATSDVFIERGSGAPPALGKALAARAKALRAFGVPTKFVVLKVQPRRPIPYSAKLRAQHRKGTSEDANVIVYWPRTGFVAFDARVSDTDESAAFDAALNTLSKSVTKGLINLAQRLALDDAITGGSQPPRGPISITGPQGPITATPCIIGLLSVDERCARQVSDVAVDVGGVEITLRVRVSVTCVPGAGSYQVRIAPPSGFEEPIFPENPDPAVCAGAGPGTGAPYLEELVFESTRSYGPGPRGANATWKLLVNEQVVAESSLQILRRGYLPAVTRTISDRNRDDFFNICLDGEHRVYSAGGTLYCTDFEEASSNVVIRTE